MSEPSRTVELVKYTVAAAALVAIVIGVVLYLNQGSHVRLEGRIQKVRAIATGDESSLALVDFRVKNPAKVRFIVREVRMKVVLADGTERDGLVSAQGDLDRVIGYYPQYGPRYNDVLKPRVDMSGGDQRDWCVGAGFDFAASALEQRRNLILYVEDVDGAVVEIREKEK